MIYNPIEIIVGLLKLLLILLIRKIISPEAILKSGCILFAKIALSISRSRKKYYIFF